MGWIGGWVRTVGLQGVRVVSRTKRGLLRHEMPRASTFFLFSDTFLLRVVDDPEGYNVEKTRLLRLLPPVADAKDTSRERKKTAVTSTCALSFRFFSPTL